MKLYYYNGQPTNYSITTDGKVYNHITKKFLKGTINKHGYLTYGLSLPNREKKKKFAHRLVLETYAPNENSMNLEVNHKDGNKLNNNLDNLEWVTRQENLQHARENGLNGLDKKIYAYDDNKELVGEWRSLAELYRATGWQIGIISNNAGADEKIKINGFYWSFSKINDFKIKEITTGKPKPIGKYDLNGILIEQYCSRAEAARKNNINPYHISEACHGKIKTYKGFIWKYLI